METLTVPPDYDSYAISDRPAFLSQALDGGLSRQRLDLLDASRLLTLQWTTRANFAYLRDFYRRYIGRNSAPFLIPLYSADATLQNYVANFVTFQPITSQDGITQVITAQIEYLPNDGETTTWPNYTTEYRVTVAPDQANYAVVFGNDQASVSNDGALGHYARNYFNNANLVTVQWIADETEYAYLAQCYRASKAVGGRLFKIQLLLDDAPNLTDYSARFVADTFQLTQVEGSTYYITAQLELVSKPYDTVANPFTPTANLKVRTFAVSYGTFVFTGETVTLRQHVTKFVWSEGQFVFTGQKATLIRPPKTLTVAQATYTFTGETVVRGIVKPWPTGYFVFASQAVVLAYNTASATVGNTKGAAWNGGGGAVSASAADVIYVYCPFAGSIRSATILTAGGTGSCSIEVWKVPFTSAPPTSANKISASAPPTIASDVKYRDTSLAGWTTIVNAGDVLAFKLLSASVFTEISVLLAIQ